MGRAFQGRTSRERPTLEKPALSEDIGSIAAVPAAAYGRKRQVDMALPPPTTGGGTAAEAGVAAAAAAGVGRSIMRGCSAATMLRRASAFHGAGGAQARSPLDAQEEEPIGEAEARRRPPTGSLERRGARHRAVAMNAMAAQVGSLTPPQWSGPRSA
mmetsp:Transcript_89208/g.282263  ORF Transcript_89208/g.282263 Transcript_89208/m.282263 type:complete len:157 (+) Transcript_89208:465-935(+)